MTVLYTGREPFNQAFPKEGLTWEEFKVWNSFTQMEELLSLDQFLNAELKIGDREVNGFFSFNEPHTPGGLFTSLEHVLEIVGDRESYNLLAVVKEPSTSCNDFIVEEFEFVGYDLLDRAYGYSALSNLGSVLCPVDAKDLNEFGLIEDFSDVKELQTQISTIYDGLEQAETYVMAVWRHLHLGRGYKGLINKELVEIPC